MAGCVSEHQATAHAAGLDRARASGFRDDMKRAADRGQRIQRIAAYLPAEPAAERDDQRGNADGGP